MKKTAGIDDILSKLQTDAELVENEGKKFEKTTHKVEERTKRDYRKQICLTITAITATAVIVIIVIISESMMMAQSRYLFTVNYSNNNRSCLWHIEQTTACHDTTAPVI
jgi:hypothetical protein